MKTLYLTIIGVVFMLAGCGIGTDFINDPPLEPEEGYIEIQSSQSSLLLNQSFLFEAKAFDASDNPVDNAQLLWKSSNESIISINNNGLITANNFGQSIISVEAEGFADDSKIVTVIEDTDQLASIVVSPGLASLNINEQVQFTAEGFNGDSEKIEGITFEWRTSDQLVVTIDGNGKAVAVGYGTSFISAVAEGIQSNSSMIEVRSSSKRGTFQGNPATTYKVEGSVSLSIDGNDLLLEIGGDFNSSNGPGLHVLLSTTQTLNGSGIDLGELKSTSGAQIYRLSGNNDLNSFKNVLVHCVPFNITFGFAELN